MNGECVVLCGCWLLVWVIGKVRGSCEYVLCCGVVVGVGDR